MSASYDLLWTGAGIDTDVQEISNYQRIANVANPYRRARLGDDRHYYFSVVSKNSFGESAPSPFVRALPPPVPGTIDHVTVVTRDAYNAVYWKPAEKAETYRIY